MYSFIFGEYELIDFTVPQFWNDFFLFVISGEIIKVFFLYQVTKFVVFDFVGGILDMIFEYVSKKIYNVFYNNNDDEFLKIILKMLGVIITNKQTQKNEAGSNFDEFYDLFHSYPESETKAEIKSIKRSLMNETLHSYFTFIIIYFFILDIGKSDWFTGILILGFLFNILGYIFVYILIEYFNKNVSDIQNALQVMNADKKVKSFLNDYHISFTEPMGALDNKLSKLFILRGKECALDIHPRKTLVTDENIQRGIRQAIKHNREKLILISDKQLTNDAKKVIDGNAFEVQFIHFKDYDTLNNKLEKLFFGK
ncbi:hypothetical protein [Flavobacterium enshiense]|nr:hypothetical protein [Flavobacterium enshiense]